MALCPGCGEENPDRFRLCGFCGTPLAAELDDPSYALSGAALEEFA